MELLGRLSGGERTAALGAAAMPISRHFGERMFLRWPALPIQDSTAVAGLSVDDAQSRFSPTSHVPLPSG